MVHSNHITATYGEWEVTDFRCPEDPEIPIISMAFIEGASAYASDQIECCNKCVLVKLTYAIHDTLSHLGKKSLRCRKE